MEIKKSPKADLEGGKGLSILMGLVVGLAVLFVGFEWGTQEKTIQQDEGIADIIAEEEIDITRQEDTPPPPPPPPSVEQVAEVLNVVEDNVEVADNNLLSSEDDQAQAQTQTYVPPAVKVEEEEESSQQIFMVVEEMPEFPGGQAALMSFIAKSIKYPVVAQENGIQGRVTCSFVVNKDGSIVDAEVVRGIDPSLDKEALRVINTMPKWKPGKQRGKPVRVKFTVPINFRLNQ
ncbi:MAG: energy transducer TonB [Tannerella sp.]|uniref:energy transducer TonB n=1 Tax=Tannerella sp. TaxID=2382127 RepID=UPI003FA20B8E